MSYNSPMKNTTPPQDVVRLIRFSAILWIGYLVVLAVLNQILWAQGRVQSDVYYYVLMGFIALVCIGVSYWSWIQERLGKWFVPIIIAIITITPILAIWAIVKLFPPSQMLDPRGSVLMLLPFLVVAFLIVAWQYKWQYMFLVILGITVLNLVIIWSFQKPGPGPFRGALHVTLIQTVVFLALGFAISYLMNRLRQQQRSLESANIRLSSYADTLEQLATSRERNRLARELHDTLAHTLSGLAVQLETVKAYWDVNQQTARSVLDKSLETAHSGLEETRRALKALRASPLDTLGLVPAISAIAEDSATRNNMSLNLSVMNDMPILSPDVEQCIYRVAQEAITNVLKHANAKNLTVSLDFVEGAVKLIVKDDGIGFDIERNERTGHLGLVGMKERTQLIGGDLNIVSEPGSGTTIELTI